MRSLDTISNFAKFQYIEKYWEKEVPKDLPEDAGVIITTRFDTEDERVAVLDMEANLNTEESVVAPVLPENTFVSGYLGTYNVTEIIDGENSEEPAEGEESNGLIPVLLSPVRVENSDAVDGVLAMHYNPETNEWVQVEDAAIREDGYVYGTLNSFSPIAVFTFRKDLESKTGYLQKGQIIVYANGNPVKVYTTEEGKKVIENKISGKQYELTSTVTVLVGGSGDGTALDSTDIEICEGDYSTLAIQAGSYSPEVDTTLKVANLLANDCKLNSICGSAGHVHTDLVKMTLNNVTASWMGTGASICYLASGAVDANKDFTPDTVDETAPFFTKKVVLKATNLTTQLGYVSARTGMTYTKEIEAEFVGGKVDYILACASNGRTGSVKIKVDGVTAQFFQSNNRGIVESVNATIENSKIDNLCVLGDPTDSTVTGVTKSVSIDIGKGTYTLLPGTQGGVAASKEVIDAVVGKVKYSRSADITISQETKDLLGDKLIMK